MLSPPPLEVTADYTTGRDRVALKFGRQLAAALTRPEVRQFIKTSVMEQFDGDYNFLFGTHKDKTLQVAAQGGRTAEMSFKEVLFGPGAANARSQESAFLDSLAALYPLLQVALPELAATSPESWDTGSEMPLVAVLPENAEDITTVTAYDSEGNAYAIAVQEEPDELVLVVSANERLIGLPKAAGGRVANLDCPMDQEPYYSTPTTDYYFADDYFNTLNLCNIGNPPPPPPPPAPCNGCDRDCKNTKDELVKVKFKTIERLREAERWLWGKVELYALITIADQDPNGFWGLVKPANGKRKDFRTCKNGPCRPVWRNINAEVLTWNPDEIGNRMKYSWYEVDDSPISKITIKASAKISGNSVSGSVTFDLKEKRLHLGDSYVEYCDNADGEGYVYSTGVFLDFNVKQQ